MSGRLRAVLLAVVMGVSALSYKGSDYAQASVYGKSVTFESFDAGVNNGEPIKGVDISSIIAQEASGVDFYNDNGEKADIFETLSQHGVNYIRVRVWNNPATADGKSYGGGGNDVKTAGEIGRRASQYGMKLLVDFHYSDFWADPGKQRVPKEWSNYSFEEKKTAIYNFTLESLNAIRNAGADIGMVQVGNETNCLFCGEDDMYKISELFSAGCSAVKDFDPSVLRVLHFANPSLASYYEWYAQVLDECSVDYDVFATSYYPYWHGTTDNLTSVLSSISTAYDKYVMVAETAYPYTDDNGDDFANAVYSGSGDASFNYPISVQGQAECLLDVFQAVANVGQKGLGVFYWEPAWIPVPGNSYADREKLWNEHGSGWATEHAVEYDESATYAGGSSYDNQALFDFGGAPLESLDVFSSIYPQKYRYNESDRADLKNGTYMISNKGSGLFLDCDSDVNVIQSAQGSVWHLEKQKNGSYILTQESTGRAVTLTDGSDGKSTVQLREKTEDIFQSFTVIKSSDNTYAFLCDSYDKSLCLGIFDNSTYEGAWTTYNTATLSDSQLFTLTLVSEDITEPPTTEPEKVIRGDMNKDGQFNIADAVALRMWLLSSECPEDFRAGDLNGDNRIDVFDMCIMRNMLAEGK